MIPNILYKTISFNFDDLVDGKYVVVPFDSDFEFNGDPNECIYNKEIPQV